MIRNHVLFSHSIVVLTKRELSLRCASLVGNLRRAYKTVTHLSGNHVDSSRMNSNNLLHRHTREF